MWWEEVEAEGEVWTGKDGEGLDEDVCYCLLPREVWVELVSVLSGTRSAGDSRLCAHWIGR